MRALPIVLLLSLVGCAPMTFSHDPDIDFETYPSVFVSVSAPSFGASEYLAGELRTSSGFETVTTDSSQSVSLILNVTVATEEKISTDSEGNTQVEYDGTAHYEAITPNGRRVTDGTEEDTSETFPEIVEDVLDEVALNFLAPYRI